MTSHNGQHDSEYFSPSALYRFAALSLRSKRSLGTLIPCMALREGRIAGPIDCGEHRLSGDVGYAAYIDLIDSHALVAM